MTSNVEERIAALEAKGWMLVAQREPSLEPVPGAPTDILRQTPGFFRFERIWRGRPISEGGETLAQAVGAAEWQQNRISGLDDAQTSVGDGLTSIQEEGNPWT